MLSGFELYPRWVPLLCEGGNYRCVTVALFIVWKMLMLKYETEREEDSRYRNNKHDFRWKR